MNRSLGMKRRQEQAILQYTSSQITASSSLNFSMRQLKRLGEQVKMSFPTIKKSKAGEAVLLKTFALQSIPIATPIPALGN